MEQAPGPPSEAPRAGAGALAHFPERLELAYVVKQRLSALVLTGILLGVAVGALLVLLGTGLLGRGLLPWTGYTFLIVAWGTWLWAWAPWEWRHTSFTIDHDALWIRRGAFWRRVIVVPRARIQHVDISQGPLERLYGLATLVVYTAGVGYARVPLSGVSLSRARAIRDRLLELETGEASSVVTRDVH